MSLSFPRSYTRRSHEKAMASHIPRLVAKHVRSDPNTGHDAAALQRGAYMTAGDVREIRKRSSRIGNRLRWRYDFGGEVRRVYDSFMKSIGLGRN